MTLVTPHGRLVPCSPRARGRAAAGGSVVPRDLSRQLAGSRSELQTNSAFQPLPQCSRVAPRARSRCARTAGATGGTCAVVLVPAAAASPPRDAPRRGVAAQLAGAGSGDSLSTVVTRRPVP